MSDNATAKVVTVLFVALYDEPAFYIYKVDASSNKLFVLLEPHSSGQFLSVPVLTIDFDNLFFEIAVYLTIIPQTRVGYKLLDSGRCAEHRVGYHKLKSNKREWNNCFIKHQTLDKNISNFICKGLEFSAILRGNFP